MLPTDVPDLSVQEDHEICPTQINEINGNKDQNTDDRLQKMESVLSDMTKALRSMQTMRPTGYDPDEDWCASVAPKNPHESSFSSVRWENIKPFPAGVAANQMWEEWNRYIENFELAATLSNANDPVRRSQLLFLSMGTELQGIVRAAKLRPSLNDADCYRKFVANIRAYFQSMTDASAEHEAFSNMRQLKSETAVAFHARLMAKVRLCGYSPSDHDRFVRSQLLKGLRNKDLVKAARTYGHDTNYIVQAATRDEAYETVRVTAADNIEPYAVNHVHRKPSVQESIRKRLRTDTTGPQSKRSRTMQQPAHRYSQDPGRRGRCRRCNGRSHSNFPCPALNRNCNYCGERGHYAICCRQAHVRLVEVKRSASPTRDVDGHMDQAQVLND